jgi:hypothetical protein
MFKFVQTPFDGETKKAVEKYTFRAHSAIIWESPKRVQLVTASSSELPEIQKSKNEKMQAWLLELNSGSFCKIKRALRAIFYENTPKPKPKPFFYSFKGHGGHGVDAWD